MNDDFFKRCLVVATIGDREPAILSIRHPDRRFRLEIIDHGKTDRGIGAFRFPPESYPGIRFKSLLMNGDINLNDFDYFWFACDDIGDVTHETVERMFQIAHENKLRLCQPSLSERSQNIGWPVTKHVPGSVFRYTNFVESMIPCFSREALEICLPTFGENLSGYGVDFVWAKLLGYEGLGIIDAVQYRHMISTPAGTLSNGKTQMQEMYELLDRYGIDYRIASRNVTSF